MERFACVCVSLRGLSHEMVKKPCQDVCKGECTSTQGWIALADGAGSCSHAEHGARAVASCVKAFFWKNRARLETEETRRALLDALRAALVDEAQKRACAVEDLGSTFLAVRVWKGRYVAFHLGDGVIATFHEDGHLSVLSAPENGEFCNQTWFTISPDAMDHLRQYSGSIQGIRGFLLSSDGIEEVLYNAQTGVFAPFAKILFENLLEEGRESTTAALRVFMKEKLREMTDDDLSLALLAWNEEGASPQSAEAEQSVPVDAFQDSQQKLIQFLSKQEGCTCSRKKLVRNLHWDKDDRELQEKVFLPLLRGNVLKHLGGSSYTLGENAGTFMKGVSHDGH